MREYVCMELKSNITYTVMRLDVIGEPTTLQHIIMLFGGTIKLNGWKIKRRKMK